MTDRPLRVGVHAHFLFPQELSSAEGDSSRERQVQDVEAAASLRALAEPVVVAEGLDLVDVEVRGSGGSRLVRLRVDRKGGVALETCQRVSQRLSALLDEQDPIDGRYTLEVTSPGVDHPLRDRRAFERVEGRMVEISRDDGDGQVRPLRGVVTVAQGDQVLIDVDGRQIGVPYDEVVTARQTLPW